MAAEPNQRIGDPQTAPVKPPAPNPWDLIRDAQRIAIARGESRLAEILSMVLEHRQGPLDHPQKVPGTFVTIPRAFFFDLEGLAHDCLDTAQAYGQNKFDKVPLYLFSLVRRAADLYETIVRHGRNSGVY